MKKFIAFIVLLMVFWGFACDFHFEPSVYTGKLGDTFVLTVTVVKTHRNCVITMEDYDFEFDKVQVIGITPWNEVSSGRYERKFLLSLSAIGEGFVKISKNCSKAGYEEEIMKVKILENPDLIKKVLNKEIPFETKLTVKKEDLLLKELFYESKDKKEITLDKLQIDNIIFKLPFKITLPTNEKIYVLFTKDYKYPILIASKEVFYRYDVYILAAK